MKTALVFAAFLAYVRATPFFPGPVAGGFGPAPFGASPLAPMFAPGPTLLPSAAPAIVSTGGPAMIPTAGSAYFPSATPTFIPSSGPALMPSVGPALLPSSGSSYITPGVPLGFASGGPSLGYDYSGAVLGPSYFEGGLSYSSLPGTSGMMVSPTIYSYSPSYTPGRYDIGGVLDTGIRGVRGTDGLAIARGGTASIGLNGLARSGSGAVSGDLIRGGGSTIRSGGIVDTGLSPGGTADWLGRSSLGRDIRSGSVVGENIESIGIGSTASIGNRNGILAGREISRAGASRDVIARGAATSGDFIAGSALSGSDFIARGSFDGMNRAGSVLRDSSFLNGVSGSGSFGVGTDFASGSRNFGIDPAGPGLRNSLGISSFDRNARIGGVSDLSAGMGPSAISRNTEFGTFRTDLSLSGGSRPETAGMLNSIPESSSLRVGAMRDGVLGGAVDTAGMLNSIPEGSSLRVVGMRNSGIAGAVDTGGLLNGVSGSGSLRVGGGRTEVIGSSAGDIGTGVPLASSGSSFVDPVATDLATGGLDLAAGTASASGIAVSDPGFVDPAVTDVVGDAASQPIGPGLRVGGGVDVNAGSVAVDTLFTNSGPLRNREFTGSALGVEVGGGLGTSERGLNAVGP